MLAQFFLTALLALLLYKYYTGDETKYTSRACHTTQVYNLSIVLPIFNGMKNNYLQQTLASVLQQDVLQNNTTSIELILVNDASTDDTARYLHQFLQQHDTTICIKIVHHTTNRQLPGALNTGFAEARAPLLTWISADNNCTSDFVSKLLLMQDAYPEAVFFYTDYFVMDDAGDAIVETAHGAVENGVFRAGGARYSYYKTIIANGGVAAFAYRAQVARQVGAYNSVHIGAEDWDYWIRILEQSPFAVYAPHALMYYRIHNGSMTSSMHQSKQEREERVITDAIKRRVTRDNQLYPLHLTFPALVFCANVTRAKWSAIKVYAQELIKSPYVANHMQSIAYMNMILEHENSLENQLNMLAVLVKARLWKRAMDYARVLEAQVQQYMVYKMLWNRMKNVIEHEDEQQAARVKLIPEQLEPEHAFKEVVLAKAFDMSRVTVNMRMLHIVYIVQMNYIRKRNAWSWNYWNPLSVFHNMQVFFKNSTDLSQLFEEEKVVEPIDWLFIPLCANYSIPSNVVATSGIVYLVEPFCKVDIPSNAFAITSVNDMRAGDRIFHVPHIEAYLGALSTNDALQQEKLLLFRMITAS